MCVLFKWIYAMHVVYSVELYIMLYTAVQNFNALSAAF